MKRVLVVSVAGPSGIERGDAAHRLERALRCRAFEVYPCSVAGDRDGGVTRFLAAARRVRSRSAAEPRPILILFGDEGRQRRLVWALALAGLRPAFHVVVHVRSATVPFDPSLADLFALADLIVSDSSVGCRAVRQCLAEGEIETCPSIVRIPPLVGGLTDSPEELQSRDRIRREIFGVGPEDLLVGCFAGGADDPRQGLALEVFQLFAGGLYTECEHCGFVNGSVRVDSPRRGPLPPPPSRCGRCGARGKAGEHWPGAHLYLCEDSSPQRPGTAVRLAQNGGSAILVEGRDLPRVDSERLLFERMSCMDVHLSPHHLADVEPTVLTSCALGVATITTRYGAAEELLEGAARLVAPEVTLDTSSGHRVAILDVRAAVEELLRLARDEEARVLLGSRARAAMRAHSEPTVVERWLGQLELLATD